MKEAIQRIIEAEIEAIRNIPLDGNIEAAVTCILEQVHQEGGKVVISGMGKAGQIGVNIATTLSSTGTPAIFLHPSEAQHGDLGILQKNDVLFLISNSGKTTEILDLVHLSQHLYEGIPIIGLTGNPEAELSEYCDITINTGAPKEVCPLGLTPTTSTTVMTIVGDILVVSVMKAIDFTKEEYAKRHHSGYLGKKAKNETT
jgi:arabinose-5-phosphate isomerase